MPYGINFDRERGEYYLDCLEHGKPILGVRTMHDMLALGGACYFAVLTHGPILLPGADLEKF